MAQTSAARTEARAFLGFYTDEQAAEQLRQLAAGNDRSVSAELRRALQAHLVLEPKSR